MNNIEVFASRYAAALVAILTDALVASGYTEEEVISARAHRDAPEATDKDREIIAAAWSAYDAIKTRGAQLARIDGESIGEVVKGLAAATADKVAAAAAQAAAPAAPAKPAKPARKHSDKAQAKANAYAKAHASTPAPALPLA